VTRKLGRGIVLAALAAALSTLAFTPSARGAHLTSALGASHLLSTAGMFTNQIVDLNHYTPPAGGPPVYVLTVHTEPTFLFEDIGCGPPREVPAAEQIVCEEDAVDEWFISLYNGNDMLRTGYCPATCDGIAAPPVPMRVWGWDGDDVLSAGTGNDRIDVMEGNLSAPLGSDIIRAGPGDDTVSGGDGRDLLLGEGGADEITGGEKPDAILAGAGADRVEARDGVADEVDCGLDEDTAFTDPVDTRLHCDPPPEPPLPPQLTSPPAAPTPQPSAAPIPTPAPELLRPKLRTDVEVKADASTFERLQLTAVPAGSTVAATCRIAKKRSCGTFERTSAPATLRIKGLERKALPPGARIEIRVTKPAAIGAHFLLTVRKGKRPSLTTRCIAPGAYAPSACNFS
jgi:hypothetical protein